MNQIGKTKFWTPKLDYRMEYFKYFTIFFYRKNIFILIADRKLVLMLPKFV